MVRLGRLQAEAGTERDPSTNSRALLGGVAGAAPNEGQEERREGAARARGEVAWRGVAWRGVSWWACFVGVAASSLAEGDWVPSRA